MKQSSGRQEMAIDFTFNFLKIVGNWDARNRKKALQVRSVRKEFVRMFASVGHLSIANHFCYWSSVDTIQDYCEHDTISTVSDDKSIGSKNNFSTPSHSFLPNRNHLLGITGSITIANFPFVVKNLISNQEE